MHVHEVGGSVGGHLMPGIQWPAQAIFDQNTIRTQLHVLENRTSAIRIEMLLCMLLKQVCTVVTTDDVSKRLAKIHLAHNITKKIVLSCLLKVNQQCYHW